VSQSLSRASRVIRAAEFRRIYNRGQRARGEHLVVVALRRRDGMRLGLSVSKAHGPAVRRNKIKRILREAFRLERAALPGSFDLVLIPRERERFALAAVRAELAALVAQLESTPPRRPRRQRARQTPP
jgi:ribonuclease P protein component